MPHLEDFSTFEFRAIYSPRHPFNCYVTVVIIISTSGACNFRLCEGWCFLQMTISRKTRGITNLSALAWPTLNLITLECDPTEFSLIYTGIVKFNGYGRKKRQQELSQKVNFLSWRYFLNPIQGKLHASFSPGKFRN